MTAGLVVFPDSKDERWDLEVLAAAAHWALVRLRRAFRGWCSLLSKATTRRLGRCFVEDTVIPRTCRRGLKKG